MKQGYLNTSLVMQDNILFNKFYMTLHLNIQHKIIYHFIFHIEEDLKHMLKEQIHRFLFFKTIYKDNKFLGFKEMFVDLNGNMKCIYYMYKVRYKKDSD